MPISRCFPIYSVSSFIIFITIRFVVFIEVEWPIITISWHKSLVSLKFSFCHISEVIDRKLVWITFHVYRPNVPEEGIKGTEFQERSSLLWNLLAFAQTLSCVWKYAFFSDALLCPCNSAFAFVGTCGSLHQQDLRREAQQTLPLDSETRRLRRCHSGSCQCSNTTYRDALVAKSGKNISCVRIEFVKRLGGRSGMAWLASLL